MRKFFSFAWTTVSVFCVAVVTISLVQKYVIPVFQNGYEEHQQTREMVKAEDLRIRVKALILERKQLLLQYHDQLAECNATKNEIARLNGGLESPELDDLQFLTATAERKLLRSRSVMQFNELNLIEEKISNLETQILELHDSRQQKLRAIGLGSIEAE